MRSLLTFYVAADIMVIFSLTTMREVGVKPGRSDDHADIRHSSAHSTSVATRIYCPTSRRSSSDQRTRNILRREIQTSTSRSTSRDRHHRYSQLSRATCRTSSHEIAQAILMRSSSPLSQRSRSSACSWYHLRGVSRGPDMVYIVDIPVHRPLIDIAHMWT